MTTGELATVEGTVFIVSSTLGNVIPGEAQGLFVADTRYLNRYELRIDHADIILLRAGEVARGVSEIYATNSGKAKLPPHSLEVVRRREIGAEFQERIELTNRGEADLVVPLSLRFDADFADIFEVRAGPDPDSSRRASHWTNGALVLTDRRRKERQTRIELTPAPGKCSRRQVHYEVTLTPRQTWSLLVCIYWSVPQRASARPLPVPMLPDDSQPATDWRDNVPSLLTDDRELAAAYNQAIDDLTALEIALDSGQPIPAAGLPWYLAIFGRDSIITSLQSMMCGTRQTLGTLRTLAAYQSYEDNEFHDAEPGKIAHEIRFGELAVSGAIPHAQYYGTVDATPLWIVLLREATRWGMSTERLLEFLPVAEAAFEWLTRYGDIDGDGFVEYRKRSPSGLENQGWKDSWDSMRFADGVIAEGPIALVEVQGYAYAARVALAELYSLVGREAEAGDLLSEAAALKRQLHDAFWMPDEGYYALALDGRKRQVNSVTSNPGHLLWTGAINEPHATHLVERLTSPDLFSGWGIRTMSNEMGAYNPLSYHNGTVWPHDNSLIIAGMARYGFGDKALTLIDAMLDAATHFERNRLPELFCGYARSRTPFPIDYPVACSPQAWASGSIILMLQTMAGIAPTSDGLSVAPLDHGRRLRLNGVPFQDGCYRLVCEPENVRVDRLD